MSNHLKILFLLTGVVAFALSILWIKLAKAQTSCTNPPTGQYHWAQGSTVYYSLDSSLDASAGGQQAQIKAGLAAWNTANSDNGSMVTFVPADQTHPATLTFQANTQQTSVPAGWAANPTKDSQGNITSAITVNINVNARVPCGTNLTCAVYNSGVPGYDTIFQKVAEHEIGHAMGLDDVPQDNTKTCGGQTAGGSIMNGISFGNDTSCNALPTQPTSCDNSTVGNESNYSPPSCPPQTCGDGYSWDPSTCTCLPIQGCDCNTCGCSPILIDVGGSGFQLTDYAHGVFFDMKGTGHSIQMAWTAPGADIAFLALPGTDGLVHNGKQLFGTFTPQPPSTNPNGFAALAVYDQPPNGGNGDGVIDSNDAIFSRLRLWIDANHDGISQPQEIYTLPSLGVYSVSLSYKWAARRDQYGNFFRYRAEVNPGMATTTGRMAYDVFFVATPNTAAKIPNKRPASGVGPGKCSIPGAGVVPQKAGKL